MGQVHAFPEQSNEDFVEAINPATNEVIERFDLQTKAEAEQVIDRAHEAFLKWKEVDIESRGAVIRKIGELIGENKEKFASMMAQQMGKPLAQGRQEVELCVKICDYTAENGPNVLQDEERGFGGGTATVTYEPMGVVWAVQPWNFPLYQVVRYSVANLMAGNTTVLKHAENVWGTARFIKEIYEQAGLEKDAFGLLFVRDEGADELIAHDKVRGVTLTGSAKAGQIVAAKAGEHLKKTVLELGGSDPYIVLEDADLDNIMNACVQGRVNNGGQTCVAAKRFIVVDDVYEQFKEKFVQAMEAINYGDPTDENNDMGPLARQDLRDNLHDQVTRSIQNGATCLTGGEIPDMEGAFYPPTVLDNVKPGMPAYDEELFGPVASLIRVKNEDEAIRVANDHRYGLGGGVFSSDESRAVNVARQIDTGMVNINGYFIAQPELPFGGVKDSGYGREHGGFGMREFVNVKPILKARS